MSTTLDGAHTTSTDTPSAAELTLRAELVARATSLHPVLRANIAEAELERRLPQASVDALTEAGLLRLLTPKRFGGYEVGLRTYLDVTAEIARGGCSASAWYAFILNQSDWVLGTLQDEAQQAVWNTGPDTKLCAQLNPMGPIEITPADGGVRVSGRWGFASAGLHSTWTIFGWPVIDERGEPVDLKIGLVRIADLEVEDTWYSAGMAGTGSNTFVARDVFIPDEYQSVISLALIHQYPTPHKDEYAYQQNAAGIYSLAAFPPALGLAQAALEQTLAKLARGGKSISYTRYADSSKAPTTQLAVAQSATLIDCAFLQARAAADELDAVARTGRDMSPLDSAKNRMRVANAARNVREAIDLLLNVQGAGSFALVNPLQRLWRDINTCTRHGLVNSEMNHEVYGRALVGADEQQMHLLT